ncbi:MAG: hypothetical protein FWH12_09620, partial [Treponema sp.]|nr:hypothetical protein [Treponema sp.]
LTLVSKQSPSARTACIPYSLSSMYRLTQQPKSPPEIFAAPAQHNTRGSIEDDHREPPAWYSQWNPIITHCKVVEESRFS